MASTIWSALGGTTDAADTLRFTEAGGLPSTFAVSDLASAAVGAAGLAAAELSAIATGKMPPVIVDRRLASFWFGYSLRPIGWDMPPVWDSVAGDYAAEDGWIRLHTNAPHHRRAAIGVLGCPDERAAVRHAVAGWRKTDLESAIVAAGGCAAEMREAAEWLDHPQGAAIAREPLADIRTSEDRSGRAWQPAPGRPLRGIRVLDLTRVLAGPVATRFLAGYGAEVLRIDPPFWDEPAILPEVTVGKRRARLDLRQDADRSRFEDLLRHADVLVHGYRAEAFADLGYDAATRRALAPGLIDVCLNAYGWTGPWTNRRGFDSLVQMSAGIADTGMRRARVDRPNPLPVQALDQATGYLLAAVAIRGLTRRVTEGGGTTARLSLARTAKLLIDQGDGHELSPFVPERESDLAPTVENTDWGPARRLLPPVVIEGDRMEWAYPAGRLGTAEPRWL